MTNKLAIWIGLIVIGLLILDQALRDGDTTIFLLRKLADLIEYLAFWR